MSLHSQQPLNQSVHFVVVPCGSTLLMHRTVRTLPALSLMSFSLSRHQLNGNETKVFGLYLIESEGWEIIRQSHVVKLLRAESVWLHPEIKLSGCASHCWSHCDFHGSRVVLCDKTWWIHTPGNTPYLYFCVCVCVRAWPHLSTTSHDPECCLQLFSFMSSVCVSVTVACLWLVFVCVCMCVCVQVCLLGFVKDQARVLRVTSRHVSKSCQWPRWAENHKLTNKQLCEKQNRSC